MRPLIFIIEYQEYERWDIGFDAAVCFQDIVVPEN